ncbi:MAG: hypothetical protein PG981_000918 [Wolbachia endosymbiont of Ctenocephalides orientis wCori]|nr:MAG: hypothetical protein PG981_000918 [Wolbachia endosymbiont of Ctenocephalides orientis wCori]
MGKIQYIHKLYNDIYAKLKSSEDLKKYVTNVYGYLPKQITIPYLVLHIVNYNNLYMLSDFAMKAKFACEVYTYSMEDMFSVMKSIDLVLEDIRYSSNETILESNSTLNQSGEILHSTINFDILLKGGKNEQTTTKN